MIYNNLPTLTGAPAVRVDSEDISDPCAYAEVWKAADDSIAFNALWLVDRYRVQTMTRYPLLSLRIGAVAPLGPRHVLSGIAKSPVSGLVKLSRLGFEGDMQGDRERHGGPEKAVHHYPFDHYEAWKQDIGEHAMLHKPGAFGENLSTVGITENFISVGDIFALGSAVVEVSQGRQPCWRLNDRFGRKTMARDVQSTGRTGWYYRVIEDGVVAPEDQLALLDRKSPEWTITRIWRSFYVDTLNTSELRGIAGIPSLAESWRVYAIRRLESGKVEDWNRRLDNTLEPR